MNQGSRSLRILGLAIAVLLASCATDQLNRKGLDLIQQGRVEDGLEVLRQAMLETPRNLAYKADYIRERDRAISYLLALGESSTTAGQWEQAAGYFQRVIALDPDNARAKAGLMALAANTRHAGVIKEAQALFDRGELERAQAQLQGVLLEAPDHPAGLALRREIESRQAQQAISQPSLTSRYKRPVTLQFRDANLKMVFEALSRTSGINILLDKDVKADTKTTIFVKDASVEDTIGLILMQNQLEKKVLNDNTVFVYPNSPAKTKEYQDLVIRTFHFTNADAKQMLTMIKTLLRTKDIFINEKTNSLIMRDTPDAVRLAEKMVATQDLNEPEVMLEVEVLEVLRSKLTELGIKWPGQIGFSVTDTAGKTESIVGAGGAIVTTTTPSSPLTFEALKHLGADDIQVTPLSATIDLRKETGDTNLLASPRIRVRQREKAKILIGDRVPVITNSVTPVASGTPVVTGNVQYLDVGLKLEVEPEIHMDGEVAIKTFLEVSSIGREVTNANSGTVAYQIGTRTTSTVLRLKDGETQVLAGLINDEDRKGVSGVPILGDLPIIGRLFSSHKSDTRKTEIILSITPHIIRNIRRPDADLMEFWSGTDTNLRTLPLTLQPVGLVKDGGAGQAGPRRPAMLARGAVVPAPLPPAAAAALAAAPLALTWQGANQAKVGEQFQISIQAQTSASVIGVPMQVSYDPALLELVSVAEGDFLRQGNLQTSFSQDVDLAAGQVRIETSRMGASGASGSGSLATLTFRALAAQDQTPITVSVPNAADNNGGQLVVTVPGPNNITISP
ncbi:MAG: cohesin domain-containing protein [Hydrogenophilaceae bacterium]